MILLLPTNVSLPTSLDHSTKTSPDRNDWHRTDEDVLIAFCPR